MTTSTKRLLHFGVYIRNTPMLKISRENYAIINKKNSIGNEARMQRLLTNAERQLYYEDAECTTYSDAWCQKHREDCLRNFDLNMKYMSNLSSDDFIHALNAFLLKNKGISQITDLTTCDYMEGVYILVLDAYKQVYIGQSTNIKKRILSHWSKTKPFDRLIFGRVENSILSIDTFGALDTTRIFVYPTSNLFEDEAKLVRSMDSKYMLNRTAGGIGLDGDTYKLEVIANATRRNLK